MSHYKLLHWHPKLLIIFFLVWSKLITSQKLYLCVFSTTEIWIINQNIFLGTISLLRDSYFQLLIK